jgi:hypothetical protein
MVLCAGCTQQSSGETGPNSQTSSAAPSRGQLQQSQLRGARGDRSLRVALDERTVTGQTLPKAVGDRWRTELASLSEDQDSLIEVVADPARADWLVQVAAIERADVLYLAPSATASQQADDESLIMLPPGQPAMAALKAQLENIARAENLVKEP